VDTLRARVGPPGRGAFDVVQLAGSLPRQGPSTFLGQGAFAWLQLPEARVDEGAYVRLARELARGWFERSVRMPAWERAGLIRFLALLLLRRGRGEEAFLAGCRIAAARADEAGVAPRPGQRLYPHDVRAWEHPVSVPPPEPAAAQAVLLLLSHLQRQGEGAMWEGLARFARAYAGREARLADFLNEVDPLRTRTGG